MSSRTAVERVTETLEKIESIDKSGYSLNSVIATSPFALDEARNYDAAGRELPLGGIPILIKDNIEARGLPASAGSLALFGRPMERDSILVSLLREAGAIIVGATNLSEWANIRSTKSTSGWSAVGGLTANPWIHRHNAGGSSSGSGAAVAAGLTQWAIGSETDGSIICPASMNGTVGIKPSAGSIPAHGVLPISRSKDVPGPMTQTVHQAAQLLAILLQKPELSKSTVNGPGLNFAVVKNWRTKDSGTNSLFDEAVRKIAPAAKAVSEIELSEPGEPESKDEFDVLLHELTDDLAEYLASRPHSPVKTLDEIIAFNERNADKELKHFDQDLFLRARELKGKNDEYRAKYDRNLSWAQSILHHGFSNADILIGSTFAPAWESNLETGDTNIDASWITMAPAIAGFPIGTLPMGLVNGLPVGIGIVARRGREDQLISAMALIERVLGLGVLRPSFIK